MRFVSHVPSSVDADPAIPDHEFESLSALLAHPWIAKWNKGQPNFGYYCSGDYPDESDRFCLIAMWDEPWEDRRKTKFNKMWWALGVVNEKLELPVWKCPPKVDPD